MLNFAEQTGSGAVIIVWYYLIASKFSKYGYYTYLHNNTDNQIHITGATYYYSYLQQTNVDLSQNRGTFSPSIDSIM